MQVRQGRITEVALERFPRAPPDKDQDLAGLDVTKQALAKTAQRHYLSTVSFNLHGRAPRIGQVLLPVIDVEQVERIDRIAQIKPPGSSQSPLSGRQEGLHRPRTPRNHEPAP